MDRPAACQALLLTPPGRAALATVAVIGPDAAERTAVYFAPFQGGAWREVALRRIVYGQWNVAGASGEGVVVARLSASRVEIHCHGGQVAAASILADLERAGCVAAQPDSTWPPHGTNRISAEAQQLLASAVTERTALILLDQFHGALQHECERLFHMLTGNEPDTGRDGLRRLLATWPLGQHLTRPWKVVLAGPPNVGKSSLINALVGFQRAIVWNEPGTTRDVLTARTAIDGWPVELADTAGLRQAASELEAAGVERAEQEISRADCLLLVTDATQPSASAGEAWSRRFPSALVVRNKIDLVPDHSLRQTRELCTSAQQGTGLPQLLDAIAARLVPSPPGHGQPVLFTQRQYQWAEQALRYVEEGKWRPAEEALRQLNRA